MSHTESEALPEAFQLERFFGTARSSAPEEVQLSHLGGGRPTPQDEVLTLPVNRESTAEEVEGLQWFDVTGVQEACVSMASLTPSCFSLVLVCALRGVRLWMPMALTTPIFISQFGVLYIVAFGSPQYLWASGAWLEPNSASNSLNAMKTFATVLMLGQIAEEFHEISESMKVLRRSRLSSSSKTRLTVCWGAIMAQYVLALMVMVASGHLILSRQNPIEPLWITYYTFMTLNFDNMLVKLIMYIRTMQRVSTWTVKITEPETPHSLKRKWRSDCLQSLAVLYLPLLLAASVSIFSRVFNVLPMTLIRYGYVSNDRPVVMFSSLALPAGCCPAVASINSSASGPTGDGVSVSVPCLGRDAPEDLSPAPIVLPLRASYWVAWPSHASSPSSLQVREGRGSDGSKAVLSGRVEARPLELVTWMQHHGYQATDVQEVFLKLSQDQGGMGMYRQTFPYLASFEVFPFPWDEEVAIYAIARNQKTGALSPRPAASNVLHSRQCPGNCDICSHLGHCRKCKEGYRITDLKTCEECPEGCLSCQDDLAKCSQCKVGFGLCPYAKSDRDILHACVPCATPNCGNCDRDFVVEVPPALMCNQCESGYGMVDNKCEKCEDAHCLDCQGLKNCTSCEQGFALVQGNTCDACGPACLSCRAQDDCIQCQEGYVVKKGECLPCSIHCSKCDKSGEQACDKGSCHAGFGSRLGNGIPGFRTWSCERCQVPECQVCEEKLSICDECSEDFGVTVAGKCVRCGLGCATCRAAGSCLKCREGFILMDEMCHACSDRCLNCSASGPASCNRQGCAKGWTAIPAQWKEEHGAYVCRPCSDEDCSTCDVKGPGECDL